MTQTLSGPSRDNNLIRYLDKAKGSMTKWLWAYWQQLFPQVKVLCFLYRSSSFVSWEPWLLYYISVPFWLPVFNCSTWFISDHIKMQMVLQMEPTVEAPLSFYCGLLDWSPNGYHPLPQQAPPSASSTQHGCCSESQQQLDDGLQRENAGIDGNLYAGSKKIYKFFKV